MYTNRLFFSSPAPSYPDQNLATPSEANPSLLTETVQSDRCPLLSPNIPPNTKDRCDLTIKIRPSLHHLQLNNHELYCGYTGKKIKVRVTTQMEHSEFDGYYGNKIPPRAVDIWEIPLLELPYEHFLFGKNIFKDNQGNERELNFVNTSINSIPHYIEKAYQDFKFRVNKNTISKITLTFANNLFSKLHSPFSDPNSFESFCLNLVRHEHCPLLKLEAGYQWPSAYKQLTAAHILHAQKVRTENLICGYTNTSLNGIRLNDLTWSIPYSSLVYEHFLTGKIIISNAVIDIRHERAQILKQIPDYIEKAYQEFRLRGLANLSDLSLQELYRSNHQ